MGGGCLCRRFPRVEKGINQDLALVRNFRGNVQEREAGEGYVFPYFSGGVGL